MPFPLLRILFLTFSAWLLPLHLSSLQVKCRFLMEALPGLQISPIASSHHLSSFPGLRLQWMAGEMLVHCPLPAGPGLPEGGTLKVFPVKTSTVSTVHLLGECLLHDRVGTEIPPGVGCGSGVEHLPRMCKDLASTSSTTKTNKQKPNQTKEKTHKNPTVTSFLSRKNSSQKQ